MTHRATLVVADDESHVTHILSLKLRSAGFEVHVAADGEEALDLVRQHRPALIVTDFEMPFMTGDQLGIAVQQDREVAGTPLIMLTARGHKLSPDRLREANIVLLMDKPFSVNALMREIEACLADADVSASDAA